MAEVSQKLRETFKGIYLRCTNTSSRSKFAQNSFSRTVFARSNAEIVSGLREFIIRKAALPGGAMIRNVMSLQRVCNLLL